jgi:hypothetical protein
MGDFFYLEGAYLILASFILAITVFVTTREFMPKGSLKKGLLMVGGVIALFIIAHYIVTKNRMSSVVSAFKSGKTIICENRIYTKGANFIELKDNGNWRLENNHFKNKHYIRDFFTARCFVKK